MEITYFIGIITIVVTFILGELAKKYQFINNNLIPIQNLVIGVLSFVIDYIITRDINGALIFSGLTAGGMYDIINNLSKIEKKKEK